MSKLTFSFRYNGTIFVFSNLLVKFWWFPSISGLYDVLFLYLTKSRNFSNSLFSVFTGCQAVVVSIGNIGTMYLLKKKLNLSEPIINTISGLGECVFVSWYQVTCSEYFYHTTLYAAQWSNSGAFLLLEGWGVSVLTPKARVISDVRYNFISVEQL